MVSLVHCKEGWRETSAALPAPPLPLVGRWTGAPPNLPSHGPLCQSWTIPA